MAKVWHPPTMSGMLFVPGYWSGEDDPVGTGQNIPTNIPEPTPQPQPAAPAPPPPPPAPLLPTFVPITSSITAIKQAPIDTVVFNEDTVSIQQLTELLYEQIGGMELINIAREDTVSGQDVIYSPISNIGSIWGQFNPNNVIAVGSSFDTFFSRFAIDLILRGMNIPYFNEDGDLIIEIDDVLSDEEIHYQIASSGTINEVDI
jgi:hypothetical protein